ncbi:hypothetical protein PIB30_051179 [Stylosanthes scabra]|uniref:Uncharacterized protein n=1 Tax=Stylosanthes scabra TaxID=79078 RepID=A0ABU6VHZ7_9FABA|nr:hypothetical protein [Stylosanthes scabra]
MRDVLLKHPMGNSRNLLPYPIFISRLASRFQVPVFAGDVFYEVREQDMFYPYGDWKGEQPKVRRGRVIPLPRPLQVQQEEQQQPPPTASEALPDAVFTGLLSEDSSDNTGAES